MMNNYNSYNPNLYEMPNKSCDGPECMMKNMYKSSYMTPFTGMTTNQNLFNSYDGFIRGNMFSNLYSPYTANEPYPLNPTTEREDLLNKVREYGFALVDLDLYLDTHPDDREKLNIYNQYLKLDNQAIAEYENRYGPLSLRSDTLNSYPWAWLSPTWPWEVK